MSWLVYLPLTFNRHPLSLNRHLDFLAFLCRHAFTNVFHWLAGKGNGSEGDGIDGKMHEIDKVPNLGVRAVLGAVSAATLHCRSCVARRYPRSGNSCGVGGGRQLNIHGQGALVNEYNNSTESKARERLGVCRGRGFLYRNLAGSLKEHIFWFLVTFCIFCTWTDTGISNTHTHTRACNQSSVFSSLTMQMHNVATSSGVNCPAFNFLRGTINHNQQ